MTRAEYLEFVQESLAFPLEATRVSAAQTLRDTEEVTLRLRLAHLAYTNEVARILGFEEQVQYTFLWAFDGKSKEYMVPEIEWSQDVP